MTVNRGDATSGAAAELAAGLRDLRKRSGLTTRALGEIINASAAAISNWERERVERLPNEERLRQLLDALGASEDEQERLVGLRRQAVGPGQLVAGAPSIGVQLGRLIEYEQVAKQIIAVEPLLIPGLLQTGDYARATLRGQPDQDTRVTLRVGRRDVLQRRRNPVDFTAYIDTEVFARPVVPSAGMVDQLHHLLRMAELPNVHIRLVSSTTPGYTPMLAGPFLLLEFASANPVVHLEHYQASAFLWEAEDVRGFETAAEEIEKVAMTPEQSSEVIADIVKGLETT